MRVNCIPHDFKRDVFVVYFGDEPWKEIHRSIFGKRPKLDFAEKDEKAFLEIELKRSRNFALRRLSKKNYSSYEMEQLLRDRLVSEEVIEKVVQDLVNLGYINDQDWIHSFIRRHMQKKHGPKSIEMKLKAKGVPQDIIKKNLCDLEGNYPQSERISALLETKYRSRNLNDFKEKQKVIASLIRKGFDYEEINEIIQLTVQ